MSKQQKYLVVLTGPTGIGKTAAGIKIAQHFSTEIISSDSRQIYKELNIGTAVPDISELKTVPHHFIHTHSIHEYYNASKYESEVIRLLDHLFKKKDLILLVGGSMMYIDAVCKGIDMMPDVDPEIRKSLKEQYASEGLEGLRMQLRNLDPEYYKAVDLKNPNRIIHALEICLMTGKPYSSFRSNPKKHRSFSIIKTGLNCERKILHDQINTRVDKMIDKGLEQEARKYYSQRHLNALNTVGYREWFDYFDGKLSKEKTIELIKRNSRRYARKQLTWFRNDPDVQWFEPQEVEKIISYIENQIAANEFR